MNRSARSPSQSRRPLRRHLGRPAAALILVAVFGLAPPLGPAPAAAVAPRASLTDIENDVMCVSCREPLSVAQSPQALAERGYVRALIARGLTKRQVEAALVAQYGPAVLGRPPASGFNLTVYLVPPLLVALGVAGLALALPRWRRRSRDARDARGVAAGSPPPPLPAGQAERLARALAEFDR